MNTQYEMLLKEKVRKRLFINLVLMRLLWGELNKITRKFAELDPIPDPNF